MSRPDQPGLRLAQRPYKGWEAWTIDAGPLELVLVPQVGGRIMGIRWRGHDLAFTQPEREGMVEDVATVVDVRAHKRAMGMPLWGGDKTWLAPQARWNEGVPFLDLDSGAYDLAVEDSGPEHVEVRLSSPICRETGIRITRRLVVSEPGGQWTVSHEIYNASSQEVAWGLWDVSMVLRPGKVYLPKAVHSAHHQGVKTYVEEGESAAVRDTVLGALGGLAVVTCDEPRQFKFGVDTHQDIRRQRAWILGILDVPSLGLVGYYKEVPVYAGYPYAHGCVAEIFNSADYKYLEMELHGPVAALRPGQRFELVERQRVFDVGRSPQSEENVLELIRTTARGSDSGSHLQACPG